MSGSFTRRGFTSLMGAGLAMPFIARNGLAADAQTVKIGLAAPTEGQALRDGRAYTNGFNAAISYINDHGGILGGQKVEGVYASQGMTGESAKSAALRLAEREHVKALVGPHWADTAPAGLSVAKRYHLVFAPDQGGMWLYDQNYPGTFGLSCNARARTMPQIRWMEKQGVKSVVILMCDIDYNHDVEKMVRARWGGANSPVKLLDIIYYPFGQTQLTNELTKAVGMKPDFLWSEEWSPQLAVSMMKSLHDLNYKGAVSVTADLTQEDVDSVPHELSEGIYSHMDFAPDASVPANKAFTDYWQQKFGAGKLPWRSEEVIWAQTVFFLKAMDKAGTAGDKTAAGLAKIHDAMRELQWTSPTGDLVRLSAPGLGLLPRTPLAQIKNGKIEVIEYLAMTPNDWLPSLPNSWGEMKT